LKKTAYVELHNLYFSPGIIIMIKSKRMRWAGHITRMGEKRNAFSILLEKLEGKRLLERTRHRWKDNIAMDLGEIGWGGRGSIDLASG
jgi:hypothetical protein